MLWLYILLGVILLLALIVLIPIKVRMFYRSELECTLYIGFVKIRIYPPKPKKPKKTEKKLKKAKSEKAKEEKNNVSLIKEKGIIWIVDLIKKASELALGVLKDFFKHIIIKRLMLSIKVAGSDAADTAVKYGKCCSAVYPAVGVIAGAVKCKGYGVDITPDFEEKAKSQVKFELEAQTRVFWLLTLVFKHGIKGIKLLIDLKN